MVCPARRACVGRGGSALHPALRGEAPHARFTSSPGREEGGALAFSSKPSSVTRPRVGARCIWCGAHVPTGRCVPAALSSTSWGAFIAIYVFGIGFGTQPLLNSQIGAEVRPEAARAHHRGTRGLCFAPRRLHCHRLRVRVSQVSAEEQGRVQGFNYAVNTVAWATGPYAYWYMFAAYVGDDDEVLADDDGDDGKM